MNCCWNELLALLPVWLRDQSKELWRESATEIRLRLDQPPELVTKSGFHPLTGAVSREDIAYVINTASRYSPWSAHTMQRGYLTSRGGHRIGICGEAIYKSGYFSGFREISSLCIRIARDFPGIAGEADADGSILILGAPGWGKTTLVRDLIRQRACRQTVCVVDEREELFPCGFQKGKRMDVMTGVLKSDGILRLLRTMGPEVIAVDEITEPEDCVALRQAFGCGVKLLATAHAGSLTECAAKSMYQKLLEEDLFDTILVLRRDKTYRKERWRS